MARNFIAASSEYIEYPSLFSQLGTVYSGMVRFKSPSASPPTTTTLLGHRHKSGDSYPTAFILSVMATGKVRIFIRGDFGGSDPTISLSSSTSITPNVWQSAGFTRNGNTGEVFLDGIFEGQSIAAINAITANDVYDIGAVTNGSSATRITYFEGDIADACIWDVELTQDEITAFHNGVSPTLIRPGHLISYVPLWGTTQEPDLGGNGGIGIINGTPTVSITNPPTGTYKRRAFSTAFATSLTPYAPPIDPDVDLNLGVVYVPPVDPSVDFDLDPIVIVDTVLRIGELSNKYAVAKATLTQAELLNKYSVDTYRLAQGELSNRYSIQIPTLFEGELNNRYSVDAFRLAQGELGQKYAVAKSFLVLSELLNKYNVQIPTLFEGELSNKYKVTPVSLSFGELVNNYAVDAFRLKQGELSQKYKVNPVFLKLAELQNLYSVDSFNLVQGELSQEYIVQDKSIEAQLLALYSIRFATQFESIYGVTVARQFLAEAYYTISKQFEATWVMNGVVSQQLDSLFDITNTTFVQAQVDSLYSMARITQQLEGNYAIGPVVQAQFDAPYILATIPVANQLDSVFNINNTNPVAKQVKGIYSILTSQIINITGQPTITLNGEILDIEGADVSIDEGSFVWRAHLGILNIEDYVKFSINDDIILDLYGEIFNLVVESKNLSRSGPAEIDMGLVAVSPAIKHDFPRATALDLSFTSDILARTASEQALGGEVIDWQIIDWVIPANRLAIKDGAPIQLVQSIVESAGGILESKPDGQLVARPLFPVSIPNFPTASIDQTYSDSSDNLSVSEYFSPTKRLNLFRILDISSSKRDSIEFDFDEDSVTEGDLRLFPSPFETNRVIKSSRGTEIGYQFIGVSTEQRTEQVEFKEGFATLDRPIVSIDSIVWEATDLGSLTFTQGDSKVFGASVVNLYSLATITYTTKFIKYRVTGVPETDVQFRSETT